MHSRSRHSSLIELRDRDRKWQYNTKQSSLLWKCTQDTSDAVNEENEMLCEDNSTTPSPEVGRTKASYS